ncbi:hypothetical protein BD779DRAFT_1475428 [Infundibulicybe gibba]|nr:hypothetical protein BD779DRAFT_1475428 [Infundibulicybe gibba]
MAEVEVRFSARIVYKQPKASELPDDLRGQMLVLRPDISALGLPHPKQKNVTLVALGCFEFFYDTRMHTYQPLYDLLHNRIAHPTDNMLLLTQAWKQPANITWRDICQWPPPAPRAPHSLPKRPIPSHMPERHPIEYFSTTTPLRVKTEAIEPGLSIPPEPSIALSPHSTPSLQQTRAVVTQTTNAPVILGDSEMPRSVSTPTGLAQLDAEAITPNLQTHRAKLKRAASADISPLDRRPPNPGNAREVQLKTLIRELESVHKTIAENLSKENIIIQKLSTRGPLMPSPINSPSLRKKLGQVEDEFQQERRLRIEAETSLLDVERECRHPFVVPAILSAFVVISKLTSHAVGLEA